jgi:hypothetical protein
MMEILQRMSDPTAFPEEDGADQEGEEGDIADKLQNLDTGEEDAGVCNCVFNSSLAESADADALWDALSPAQRAAFTKAMEDPNSSLAMQLLHSLESEETGNASVSPWWETQEEELDSRHGTRSVPPLIQIPEQLVLASQREWNTNAPLLLYNVVCLWYAVSLANVDLSDAWRNAPVVWFTRSASEHYEYLRSQLQSLKMRKRDF